ncbi:hypothetical protein MA16_Dca022993 [Dendrobium catenatum]|uniref:Pentatricopeptide repeat-containing protein n=1 Tax=Dendrobium catenatum TaxID=906689 RepID=A0A2I0VXT9_9ASPA|nr:hypothetical protein MA16_Dca022993 [Dendrobium catenatum]
MILFAREHLLKEGKVGQSRRYMKRMVSDNILCSIESYNMLIDLFIKAEMRPRRHRKFFLKCHIWDFLQT